MAKIETDVLVLGGGVVGLACAYYLAREGRAVTVLEQATVGAGASYGNCGTITPSHTPPLAMPGMLGKALRWMLKPDAPLYVKPRWDPQLLFWLLRFARRCNWTHFDIVNRVKAELLKHARQSLAELVQNEGLDCGFETIGSLYVYRDEQALAQSEWLTRALGEVDMPIERLDGAEMRRREPALNESVVGGYFNPLDAHLRPDRLVSALKRAVEARGGVVREHCAVAGIEREGAQVGSVHAGSDEYLAREVVFALGAWSGPMARQLGLNLPVQPGKGYSVTFSRPTRAPRIPVLLKERSVCVTAWEDGVRLGSTMEFSGYDSTLNRVRLDALVRGAAEYLHEPHGEHRLEEWQGWRPMTYDDLPVIGRAPRLSNLTMATGHGMLGVTLSASTGRLVSEIVCGKSPSIDIAPYRFERFG
jgi:D-amino-acid dehydrogenase